jgi:hypothetical protein
MEEGGREVVVYVEVLASLLDRNVKRELGITWSWQMFGTH